MTVEDTSSGKLAKLREAYEFAEEFLRDYGTDWKLHNKLCDMLKSALAEPLRNCDVGTAEEQGERFKNFCRNHQFISVDSEDHFPPLYVCSNESCPLHDYYITHGEDNCELAWAQMPYDGGSK